jgi:transcriptional antiterminator NusG
MHWYVLHVRTGTETDIKRELQRQGYGAAVPEENVLERRGGKDVRRLKTLLPGYVFIRTALTPEDYYRILDVPNIIRFLGVGKPEPILEHEEDYILWLSNEDTPLEPSSVILEGDKVTVLHGPLRGYEGTILRIIRRQRRAIVAVTFGGVRKEISLSINVLKAGEP